MDISSEEAEPAAHRGKSSDQVLGCSAESMMSDVSKGNPPNFGPEPGPGPDSQSMKSDSSRNLPPLLSPGPGPDSQSMKSDSSRNLPPLLSPGPGPDSQSMKSDSSRNLPPLLSPGPGPDSQSMKSDSSRNLPPLLSPGPGPDSQSGVTAEAMKSDRSRRDPPLCRPEPGPTSQVQGLQDLKGQTQLDAIFTRLEEEVLAFVKQQLQTFHRLLASERTSETTSETTSESTSEREERSREAVLNITLDFLRRMDQEALAQRLSKGSVGVCRDELKSHLKHRFSRVFEGVAKAGDSAPLQQIYTELYITEGGASEVNQEHEVRHIEAASRRPAERAISCEDIFKQQPESEQPIRTVLSKGVAGVGKTVLTQKFSLDWTEGNANQDVQLLFPFTFRELNVLRDRRLSLVELLHHFFSQTKCLCSFQQLQLLFIFDGLDECRLPLDFRGTRVLTEPTESASVEVLLVNLIRGNLLPSARLWITTRPAAANQIPAECVSMVTEVRGFSDPQKEQYFRKRFRDEATAVISHIKSIRSLFIMSNIPIFCWILSTVLQKILEQTEQPELPKTLTQMYVHFLVVQAKVKNIKYHDRSAADLHWTPETCEMVQSLGKLAFEQLQQGNLIFYESDLSKSGLDAAEIARYSGVFTQVFREEQGLYEEKVYCFIHLTVQEFLAALHVHQTFFSSGENLQSPPHSSESPDPEENLQSRPHSSESPETDPEPTPEELFYRSAVDRALRSPNGHLDLFLRFLMGLSLPTNQRLLKGLLSQTGSEQTNQETVKYIKKKLDEEGASAERSLNLLHCLNELNDRSLLEQIQSVVRGGRFSHRDMSLAQWSAVSFLLLSSDSDLELFDLRKYSSSEKSLLGLLPVVKASTKATLSGCSLSSLSCGPLASVLSSSSLTLLDLSNNDLQDSGVELLCEGLKSAPCRLETLRLSGCLVSERGGAYLATALSSTNSHLRELDLSYNHPGASTELLTALRAPQGPLQTLSLDPAGERWMVPGLRKYACEFSLDPNTMNSRLLLSEDNRSVTFEEEEQQYPDHEGRFTKYNQVLSSTGLRGRCYWEVDWSGGERGFGIAVSYRGIRRRGGRESAFGYNHQSWRVRITEEHCYAYHHNNATRVADRVGVTSGTVGVTSGTVGVTSGTVGVFLDWEGGALSFYEVVPDEGLSHIHTFIASFTEPLFPGFGLESPGDSVSLVKL